MRPIAGSVSFAALHIWKVLPWFFILMASTSASHLPRPGGTRMEDIRVLPPSPDETPGECGASQKLDDSCGPERYCSNLPGHNKHGESIGFIQIDNTTKNETSTTYYCLHKALWFPSLQARDLLAFLLTACCCFLAAMGGIGGGGLILPILILCCNFTPKEAAVLSNTAVFFNATGQFCVNNWNWSRPIRGTSTQPQEDNHNALIYSTVLMIMPGLMAGGSIAITLKGLVPSTVILILAVLTLLLASSKTYCKAQKMRAAERELALSTQEVFEEPSRTAPRNNLFLEEEAQQHDALLSSALEYGADATTPTSNPMSMILENRASNSDNIMEETFLGSIRYLNQENPEENCVNIIDESSLTASSISTARVANPVEPPMISETVAWRHAFCLCMYQHKLQLFILACWALDATTFVLLHMGTLVKKCSFVFFVLVGLPAVIAVVFVGLGRRHLQTARRRDESGPDTEEWQPLVPISLFQPPREEEEEDVDDEEEAYEPVPNLESAAADLGPTLPPSKKPFTLGDWVLFVPLLSAFVGIEKAVHHSPYSERVPCRHESSSSDVPQPLFEPLLNDQPAGVESDPPLINRSLLTDHNTDDQPVDNFDQSTIHDDYDSLLSGWLPWATVLIGLLSALLGIGGGELLGPILLLLLRMDAQQSSATTAIMSMMNSGTNLLHYMVADMMTAPGYAANLGLAGFLGGSGGRLQAMSMAESGRTSIIAVSLFVVLSLATALVVWELATTPMSWSSHGGVC